jgi:hypothetical protein
VVPTPAAPARDRRPRVTARLTLPGVGPAGARARTTARAEPQSRSTGFYLGLIGTALALASLSLLLPSTPSYDPWAWLGWGREIVHLDLHTAGGPSWKPLPVLFTTVFAPLGSAAPDLWLVVARAGALVAVAMVFRLAFRITRGLLPTPGKASSARVVGLAAPLLAGLIAAFSLINWEGFIVQNALGYSEGLGAALMLIAVDRLMDGARRQALVLGFFAGLDRPELWFVWVPFGIWLAWRDPGARRLVLGLFALTPVLWFLPELWGSGQLFRGVVRAHHPNPGTPAFSRCPACTVFDHEAWLTTMGRVKLPAIGALVLAAGLLWRTRHSWWRGRPASPALRSWAWILVLGAGGFLWWLGIALETQAGFSGNSRYLELGTTLVAIAGGVAWGWMAIAASAAARRLTTPVMAAAGATLVVAGVLVAAPPWIGRSVVKPPRVAHALDYQAALRSDLARAIASSGGASALLSCGVVMTESYQVPMVAWALGVPIARIEHPPADIVSSPGPDVIVQDRANSGSALLPAPAQIRAWEHAGARYLLLAHVGNFRVFSTCSPKVIG